VRVVFWLSVGVAAYVYAGYPIVLALLARWCAPTHRDEGHCPTLSLIIAAHNEERVIRSKIENSLALDYPPGQLEIVVASDGSDDGTNAIVREYAAAGVVLHDIDPRGGKSRAIDLTIPRTRGEILVLSDANTMYRTDALVRLTRHFADASVGAVTGDVQLVDSARQYAASEGLYYRYERQLQTLEARLHSVVGADGGMYALRRAAYRVVPPDVIVDDLVIAMNVACAGYRVTYDPDAVATEQGTHTGAEEFRRKVRIVAGGVQALMGGHGVPTLAQPSLLWCYLSHKVLRWTIPLFLIAALSASALLARDSAWYLAALCAQATFYLVAVLRWCDVAGVRRVAATTVPYYFCLVNSAALLGMWKALARTQPVTWQRAAR
jgi:cellulose synthase/poly-beta-1,6-N-acetylglucosamine synthase-like glycosyltransferase